MAFMLLSLLSLASTQGNGLYGPDMPTDVAFVRIIHADASIGEVETQIGPTTSARLAPLELTDYYPVAEGPLEISIGEDRLEFEALLGGFYSAVWFAGDWLLLEDEPHTDPARAQLALYNLSSLDTLDLKTADADTDVITGVASGSSGQVVVNVAEVDFGVFYQGELQATIEEPTLARGEAYSIIVFGQAVELDVRYVQADIVQE